MLWAVLSAVLLQVPSTPPRDLSPPRDRTGTGVISGRVGAADTGQPFRHAYLTLMPTIRDTRDRHQPALALAVEYADGRTTFQTVDKHRGSWTPFFPKLGDPPTRNGLSLAALQIGHEQTSSGLRVEISLLYGRPHQHIEHVTTVDVTSDRKIRIDEPLRPFGVAPIQLSLVPITPGLPVPPQIESVSSNLHVEVDVSAAPRLRVTVRNLSPSYAVELFRWEGYRGPAPAMSGLRPGRRDQPELAAGAEVTFQVTPGAQTNAPPEAGWTPGWIDRFVITTVLWDDGLIEGNHGVVQRDRAASMGRALQLTRVLEIIDAAMASGERSVDRFLATIERLPLASTNPDSIADHGMQMIKRVVLQDLSDAVGPEKSAERFVRWLPDARADYAAWLARLRRLTEHKR